MSIATKTGDDGTTSLLYGRRVSKTHQRVCAYGAVDSLSSAIGLARAHTKDPAVSSFLLARQKEFVLLMAELATADEDQERFLTRKPKAEGLPTHITVEHLEPVEAMIRHCEKDAPPFKEWTMAGDTLLQAHFDFARTTCRNTEREVLLLAASGATVRAELPRYLNRLSDALWLLARDAAEHRIA